MFGTPSLQIWLAQPWVIQNEVRFIIGDEVRIWTFQEGICFAEAIEAVFPFGLSKQAVIDCEGTFLDRESQPVLGNTYVVHFTRSVLRFLLLVLCGWTHLPLWPNCRISSRGNTTMDVQLSGSL